jgi:hypothetical protein
MEAVVLCGIEAAGKTTLFVDREEHLARFTRESAARR